MTNEVLLGEPDQVLVVGLSAAAVRAVSVLAANDVPARLVGWPDPGSSATGPVAEAPRERSASVVDPDAGEHIPVAGGAKMRVLEGGRSTEHRLGITELTVPPGGAPAPVHRHAAHDEGFYVVSGSVRFFLGADEADHHDAGAGAFVMVPPGVDHGFANIGDTDAVLLNTFTPDLYLDFFRQMAALRERGEELTPERATAVMAQYATFPTPAEVHDES